MPRRYADYLPEDGFTLMNQISSAGALLLGASTVPFLYNVWKTYRTAPLVTTDDPWGYGASLEWATSCPPPRHNFESIPRIRSERPAFDLHHPEVAQYDEPRRRQECAGRLVGAPLTSTKTARVQSRQAAAPVTATRRVTDDEG